VGTSADKDIEGLAEELAPLARAAIATRAGHPRAMAPERVAAAFRRLGVPVEVGENVAESLARAVAAAGAAGLICLVVGSLFVAAEARESLLGVAAEAEG
jgi:folylpolyglutamate synthase/dihydropteroate synthase